ncbi:TNF receptor-associated factor 3-like [Xenia sp. Carnegie-2017]|uniref:TNF receptor-associated factor 3-like n=1 Tax=Xenia sp. Carnegie-2017 TaxID=2897299 RepID=UPI001F04A9E9|nr:TNF receptor-associated factor 3-like [Xenia sp. Carnegie-2017]
MKIGKKFQQSIFVLTFTSFLSVQCGPSVRNTVRIADLEAQRVRTQGSNQTIHSYNSVTVGPELRDHSFSIQRFCERLHRTETSLARNTMRIADLEAQSGARALGSNQAIIESRGGNDSNPQMSSEISLMRDRISTLERQIRDNSSTVLRFRERLDQNDESLARNTMRVADLEAQRGSRALASNQAIHSYNGTLLWKIDNFNRKTQEATYGIKTALYSPPFYSSQNGYKMCAKIYMNGDGFGRGKETHLSLFFVVMKGDYDALQTWPFQKKITMMLMDQGNGDHMINAFHSDPQSSSFQRPKSDMNIAYRSPLFMPLESLNNRQYIKDDTLFIKLIVD